MESEKMGKEEENDSDVRMGEPKAFQRRQQTNRQ